MKKEEIIKEIKKQINERIRPILVNDGGNIEFVEYDNGILKVKLLGACHGCPMASITLKNAVFEILKESILELKNVIAIDFKPEDPYDESEI